MDRDGIEQPTPGCGLVDDAGVIFDSSSVTGSPANRDATQRECNAWDGRRTGVRSQSNEFRCTQGSAKATPGHDVLMISCGCGCGEDGPSEKRNAVMWRYSKTSSIRKSHNDNWVADYKMCDQIRRR